MSSSVSLVFFLALKAKTFIFPSERLSAGTLLHQHQVCHVSCLSRVHIHCLWWTGQRVAAHGVTVALGPLHNIWTAVPLTTFQEALCWWQRSWRWRDFLQIRVCWKMCTTWLFSLLNYGCLLRLSFTATDFYVQWIFTLLKIRYDFRRTLCIMLNITYPFSTALLLSYHIFILMVQKFQLTCMIIIFFLCVSFVSFNFRPLTSPETSRVLRWGWSYGCSLQGGAVVWSRSPRQPAAKPNKPQLPSLNWRWNFLQFFCTEVLKLLCKHPNKFAAKSIERKEEDRALCLQEEHPIWMRGVGQKHPLTAHFLLTTVIKSKVNLGNLCIIIFIRGLKVLRVLLIVSWHRTQETNIF